VRVRDLQRLAPDVLAGVLPRLYPKMLTIAYEHQDAGRPIVICTAASQEMAELLAVVLTFDGAVGSRSEIVDGSYTGRPGGPFTYREGKAEAVRQLAEAEGIDLSRSWAYSDSESDLPLLRAVGHPVAVNPDGTLARVAREEGWEILRFERLNRHLRYVGALAGAWRWAAPARWSRAGWPRERADRRAGGDPLAGAAGSRTSRSRRTRRSGTGTTRSPPTSSSALAEPGFMGVCIPEEHGGRARTSSPTCCPGGAVAWGRGRRRDGRGAHERVHAAAARARLAYVEALAPARRSARSP
jgi:phosphoserine phosphatase